MGFDVHFQAVPPGEVKGSRFLTFGPSKQHVGIRGIQKLVNRYLKCLLTPRGSDISDPNYGTSLMAAFTNNIDPRSLQTLVMQAVQDAADTLRLYDAEYSPDEDERLASVEIERLLITADRTGAELAVRIYNEAGTVVLSRLPIVLGQVSA